MQKAKKNVNNTHFHKYRVYRGKWAIFKTFIFFVFRMGWFLLTFSMLIAELRADGAPWVRKFGNPSVQEIMVRASGMARGCVRLRPTHVALDDIFTWSNFRSARPCLLAVSKVFSTSDTISWNWVLNRVLWLKRRGNPVITSKEL